VGKAANLCVVVVKPLTAIIGKACPQNALVQGGAVAHLNGQIVAKGAQAMATPERLVHPWQHNGPQPGLPRPQQAHGGAKERMAMGKIGGAVQGIHTPEEIAHFPMAATLLRQDGDSGCVLAQHRQDGGLSGFIRIRDQLAGVLPFVTHRKALSVKPAQLMGARLGGAARHRQQGMGLGCVHG